MFPNFPPLEPPLDPKRNEKNEKDARKCPRSSNQFLEMFEINTLENTKTKSSDLPNRIPKPRDLDCVAQLPRACISGFVVVSLGT